MANLLEVRKYNKKDYKSVVHYSLPAEQALYTSMPIEVINTFLKDTYNQPFVICSGENIVGCFAFYTEASGNIYTSNQNAILLKSFSIDSRHQKKGYAYQALRMLPQIAAKFYPAKDEIILTVHETNEPAISLYKKAGFQYRGKNYNGEYGIEMIFHMGL
ncbi:GNAT family N-acetyltransferase [Fictibacillus barbaricus]|uniref:GNAT family N-acetyltransferase n=1 Tax=Fictibacillus barbaricus TaxID=182136 RepID=UPI0019BAD800|nr:GNAT family N-acetyltransferase [Fictibacillus barbaricus]GGB63687.1 hypothetical protein GCM10007199_32160 [Fictibacillus barbaricus]